MLATGQTFIPSATAGPFTALEFPQAFAMPAVDGANPQVVVDTTGCFDGVWLNFGTVAADTLVRFKSNAPTEGSNCVYCAPGTARVVPTSAGAGTATFVAAMQAMRGGSFTIKRGALGTALQFT
jgi:hypothetical protein